MRLEIEQIKKKIYNYGQNIEQIFQYLDELILKTEHSVRKQIGFPLKKGEHSKKEQKEIIQ